MKIELYPKDLLESACARTKSGTQTAMPQSRPDTCGAAPLWQPT